MSTVCPSCGTTLPMEAAYCAECGTAVEEGSAEETVEDTTLAALTHVFGLLTWVVGPLIVLLASEDPFVVQNAKNALMWQLMLAVYGIISMMLIVIVVGLLLLPLLLLLDLIFCIIAAIKAREGTAWQYPLTPSV